MRQILFMLLIFSLLTGNALTGVSPVTTAHAQEAAMVIDQARGCEHHEPQQPSDHGKPDCCAAAHCPMLSLGLLPTAMDATPALRGLALHPAVSIAWSGIVRPPALRPPRSVI